jgi:hypothetical protein
LREIWNCKFFTAADLQRFRCRTLLNFHSPVTKRSVRVALRGNLLFAAGESAREARRAAKPPPNARNVKNFHCLVFHGIVWNSELLVFHRCRFSTLPLPNAADFSRSRGKTRVWRRAKPTHGGEAAAGFAFGKSPNARNVKNFHYLISHGIVRNSELLVFHRLIYHGIMQNQSVNPPHSKPVSPYSIPTYIIYIRYV